MQWAGPTVSTRDGTTASTSLIDLPRPGAFTILRGLEGDSRQTGIVLATPVGHITRIRRRRCQRAPVDQSLEAGLMAVEPLPPRSADKSSRPSSGGGMKGP